MKLLDKVRFVITSVPYIWCNSDKLKACKNVFANMDRVQDWTDLGKKLSDAERKLVLYCFAESYRHNHITNDNKIGCRYNEYMQDCSVGYYDNSYTDICPFKESGICEGRKNNEKCLMEQPKLLSENRNNVFKLKEKYKQEMNSFWKSVFDNQR